MLIVTMLTNNTRMRTTRSVSLTNNVRTANVNVPSHLRVPIYSSNHQPVHLRLHQVALPVAYRAYQRSLQQFQPLLINIAAHIKVLFNTISLHALLTNHDYLYIYL